MNKTLLILLVVVVFAVAIAREWPAGVNPSTCPNYPFCNVNGDGAPLGYVFDTRHAYPPGVHPSACPKYPYC